MNYFIKFYILVSGGVEPSWGRIFFNIPDLDSTLRTCYVCYEPAEANRPIPAGSIQIEILNILISTRHDRKRGRRA